MAAFRSLTTTVLEPTILKTLELEDYESWVLTQIPEYYRFAKGADRLPLEELIDSDLLDCICVDLGITRDEFTALGKTATLPGGDDNLKFAEIDRVICPFLDQHEALVAIRKVKMSPTGHYLTAFMEYNKRFKFWIRLVSAPALSGKLVAKPLLKDVVKVYADNLRSKIAPHVRDSLTPTTTLEEASDLAKIYITRFRAAEELLKVDEKFNSKKESNDSKESKPSDNKKSGGDKSVTGNCGRCGKPGHTKDTCRSVKPTDVCDRCGGLGHIRAACKDIYLTSGKPPAPAPQQAPTPAPTVTPTHTPAKPTHVRWSAESVVTELTDKAQATAASKDLDAEIG
jgi:hypothetical protein